MRRRRKTDSSLFQLCDDFYRSNALTYLASRQYVSLRSNSASYTHVTCFAYSWNICLSGLLIYFTIASWFLRSSYSILKIYMLKYIKHKKIAHRMGENICKLYIWYGYLIFRLCTELLQVNKNKKSSGLKIAKGLEHTIYPKKIYQWPLSMWKDT